MPPSLKKIAFHEADVAAVIAALGTDANRGLSAAEASARLTQHGRNELTAAAPVPLWRKLLAQFTDVLVILLIMAGTISAAIWWFERASALPYEAIAIFAIVLLNAVMGYVQEASAEASLAKLRAMSAAEANVLRDGERHRVSAAELVPGDVILVEEGDTIPADARLIHSPTLQVAEAALTGESMPSSKSIKPAAPDAPLGDRHNMLFSGTAATYGRGAAAVTATGMNTEMGRIAGMLKDAPVQ